MVKNSRLTEKEYHRIKNLITLDVPHNRAAKYTGRSTTTVKKISESKSWDDYFTKPVKPKQNDLQKHIETQSQALKTILISLQLLTGIMEKIYNKVNEEEIIY